VASSCEHDNEPLGYITGWEFLPQVTDCQILKDSAGYTRVSQKAKGLLKKSHLFKNTETKLISLFNVIPLDFNAPVPAFHKVFNSVRRRFFACVFNHFCTAPVTSTSNENLLPLKGARWNMLKHD
jgi:hypothetical protein